MYSPTVAKCMKVFLIQRIEKRTATDGTYKNTGNLTADFFDQMLQPIDAADDAAKNVSQSDYMKLSESDVNERLHQSVRKFFNGREIKLHVVPGMQIRVTASPDDSVGFSITKSKIFSMI